MATLNELGRNSASITYGPSSTGADQWPTLALVDQWVRNDTLQGYATTTGTSITGVSSIYTTQVRAGDVLMVAGAMRTVQSTPTSDSSITVTQAFTTATVLPSAVKVINTTLTGTVAATVRGSTTGVVAVTNGSATITGVGTYFLSECTNSVTLTSSLTGTAAVDTSGNITGVGTVFVSGGASNGIQIGDSVQIGSSYFVIASVVSDTTATVVVAPGSPITATTIAKATNGVVGRVININGRIRTITGISSNNSITVNLAMDFTDSGLKLKTYPRGTIAVSAGSATVAGTSTNFSWDLVSGDQVWVGDELRTFSFAANATTVATLTDYTGYTGTAIGVLRQAVTGINFKRDDTYITGTNTLFTSELRVGDELLIDGTEVTVSQILSNTSFRITSEFTHNMSVSVVYKKKKIHGYILEGTREGAATGGKFTTGTTSATAAGSGYLAGAYVLNVASATNFNQYGIIKIQGAGGPPRALTGQINTVSATTTVTGVNTLFTTELHVGAEIVIAGQYFTVTAIASDTSMTVNASMSVTGPTPLYRSIPLYTYIASVASTTITLGHAIRNTVYSNGANPPLIYTPSGATDYIEYVYSAPNKSAEASTTLFNTSLDRKYWAFRFYPLATGGGSGNSLSTAGCAYNLVVYERWTASYGMMNGVGINAADYSNGTSALSGVTDQTSMTQTTGGFLYLFGKPRYMVIQGKTFANVQTQWLGCVEFERAQPEDVGTGLGTSAGVSISTGNPVSGTPAVSPWPCFAYFNGNRFPVGSTQTPTSPVSQAQTVHGGIFSTPRVRCSTGDLVGANAHVYSAATITTGRWGHLYELGATGAYTDPSTPAAGVLTNPANTIPQPHMGQLVPVYTNVYNSKRFMFSPVVVLGPAYDPDIRGRIYGLKVIPSGLGTLMDTVSVTIDSNDFYDAGQSAADHWVVTASVTTYRYYMGGTTASQGYRSLEDPGAAASANTKTTFTNNFRWALPA